MADEAAVEVSDDLRSALAAAITEHEAPEPIAQEKPKAEAPPELPLDEGRARGPDGKFVKKEETEEPAEEAAPEEAAAEEPAEEPKAEEPKGLEPPALWKAADKETFKKLPAEAQKIVLDIQKRQDADYTKKTQEIAAFRTEYGPVDKMFEPYRDVMKQKGFTPRTLIEAWANVEKRLVSGPDEAANVIKGLVSGYNVDPSKVALALGLKQQAAPQTTEGEQPAPQIQLPPELMQTINGLQQKVNSFEAERRTAAEQAAQQRGQAVMNEIEKFKSAVDDKGTLLRPHFDEVEQDMTNLALAHKAAGQQVPSLNDLYEKAVWANPSTREKLITAQAQQAEQKRKDEARAKAAAAKKAAASVTGAPGTGQAPQGRSSADKSLREQLEEAADELAA